MLRSLVGSEMCIRDSFCSSVPHWKMGRACRPRCTAIVSRTEESAYSSPCLLYTSDAADDLLCVDLGGRRIIKKKNTTTFTLNHIVSNHYFTTRLPQILVPYATLYALT